MNKGDILEFSLFDGSVKTIELISTDARVIFTTLSQPKTEERGARTYYEFTCRLKIEGQEHTLRREVPTQASFYEPWEIEGVRIWFDAVDAIFEFLVETHGPCRPTKDARFAFQDATRSICPEPVHPWCPLPTVGPGRGMDIMRCYCGEDCWLGPYFGASAHGGLDINHDPGTPLWAPIGLDDHEMYDRVEEGEKNNRWRGRRTWPDGSEWVLACFHMTRLTAPEHAPLKAGQRYADGAGVHSGYHHHSHFAFQVIQDGAELWLDPWILFRQMYIDRSRRI